MIIWSAIIGHVFILILTNCMCFRIESEDQLDTAKKPEDNNSKDQDENDDCKEENGIDMSEDFDSKLQDLDKESNSDQSDNDEEEELDKQMGKTEEGTNE